jgi:hypothetical protein
MANSIKINEIYKSDLKSSKLILIKIYKLVHLGMF